MPYLFIVVSVTLGLSFKQSRVIFAALSLGAAYFLIQQYLQTRLAQPDNYVLFSALSVLLPVQLSMVSLYRERGLFTTWGVVRLLIAVFPYGLLFFWMQNGSLAQWLPRLPSSMIEMLYPGIYLSDAASLVFLLSVMPLLLVLAVRKGHMESALLATFLAILIMLAWFDQVMITSLFASAALIALSVAVVQHSYSMAFLDELTGIPARRALMHLLATLGKRYTIAMLDIDHFKKFNDTYGHDVGDQVLRMVAAKIAQIKGGGKAFRYGGEEFTIVFAGKDESQAIRYLEEIREMISQYEMKIRDQNRPEDHTAGRKRRKRLDTSGNEIVQVTISIGLAQKGQDHVSVQDVIKSADQALYAAKEHGRNCTVARSTGEMQSSHRENNQRRKGQKSSAPRDFAR